jgi:hypothetical protein
MAHAKDIHGACEVHPWHMRRKDGWPWPWGRWQAGRQPGKAERERERERVGEEDGERGRDGGGHGYGLRREVLAACNPSVSFLSLSLFPVPPVCLTSNPSTLSRFWTVVFAIKSVTAPRCAIKAAREGLKGEALRRSPCNLWVCRYGVGCSSEVRLQVRSERGGPHLHLSFASGD